MNQIQAGLVISATFFVVFSVFVGLKGSKRNIGFLIPFLCSLISPFLGFYFIGIPSTFKATFSTTLGIIILIISAFAGPLITLALTLTSERKEKDI
jgi:hypothetical protein